MVNGAGRCILSRVKKIKSVTGPFDETRAQEVFAFVFFFWGGKQHEKNTWKSGTWNIECKKDLNTTKVP